MTESTYQIWLHRAEKMGKSLADYMADLSEEEMGTPLFRLINNSEAIRILSEALRLKPQAGGAIKEEIRKAIAVLSTEE